MNSADTSVLYTSMVFRRYKYVYVCMQNAAAAAAAAALCVAFLLLLLLLLLCALLSCYCCCRCLLLLLLLLFAIVHLPPEVVLRTYSSIVALTAGRFFITTGNTLEQPLAVQSLSSGLRFPILYPATKCLSWPLRECTEPQAGACPPRRSPAGTS